MIPEIVFSPRPIAAYADIQRWISQFKSRVAGGILAHLDQDTDHLDRVIECAELASLPGAFIACAFYQRDLNETFTRAGLFMGAGKGFAPGMIPSARDYTLLNYQKLVAGHNLPGRVIIDFGRALEVDSDGPTPAEAGFLNTFLKHPSVRERDGEFYVIGVSVQSMKPQDSVISHEIFHAYRYLRPRYRAIIDLFWRERISAADRASITVEIGRGYNVDDEDLVIDEFQAYLLQENAGRDRARAFVPTYRDALIEALRDGGELPDFVRA